MGMKVGKEEIAYLLEKVVEKYQISTNQKIVLNTNPKNYEALARVLSAISNQLPYTAPDLQHASYPIDPNPKQLDYPYRRYDITGVQIKDALNRMVANPRPFLVDACYIYLYGVGRKGFEKDPQDPNLIEGSETSLALLKEDYDALEAKFLAYQQEADQDKKAQVYSFKKQIKAWRIGACFMLVALLVSSMIWFSEHRKWNHMSEDMNLLPYQPTQAEINSLEGIWMYYTGSPQAKGNDPKRYHQMANNLVEITYKEKYFNFYRHGANIDHIGYVQFESPSVLSIHSHVKNNSATVESPIHALLRLDSSKNYLSSIAASWSFDTGTGNDIIGLRNVFVKLGKGGKLEEIINTPENASCHCRIMKWVQPNKKPRVIALKYSVLDELNNKEIERLIDENSILLREPKQGIIIKPQLAQ